MKSNNIKNIRKSIISMMIIMVMTITMVGCNKETTESTPNVTIDETISSEITETTAEVVSEEVENTKVEISRESTPCLCCDGVIHYFVETEFVNNYSEIPDGYRYETDTFPNIFEGLSEETTIYGKLTEDIDFYGYSEDGDFVFLRGYISENNNIKINTLTDNKDWVIVYTECCRCVVRYEDIITNNLYVEIDEFKFDYEEVILVENTENVQPEQPSNNEPETVQPTTEEPTTPPPSTPTTEEVVVEPTPEPEPEPTPTVTADQIVAEFNAAFTACGMQQMPDTNGMGYAGIRCHAGNYVDQAWGTASYIAGRGYKYFYITISDNGNGSFMVTYYTGGVN